MPFAYFYRLLKAAVVGWYSDNAPSMGAALAYYTIFSIAPSCSSSSPSRDW
jgi:uncharacterized BrkB/YihY/UPF0761 family membrane protein